MKKPIGFFLCVMIFSITTAFAAADCDKAGKKTDKKTFHKEKSLPDPQRFQAHFPDLDKDGDRRVTPSEFKDYFPGAKDVVFQALDLDGDGGVDHDEWHEFKKAHGL
jgi:hypothetical protein